VPTNRLEAFSDGVLAVIITIMVLELKVPEGRDFGSLSSLVGISLLTYLLSFIYIGIYWSNHHHLMHATDRITGGALWANLHLLFWLSLVPFTTAWVDESDLAGPPVVIYGINLLAAAMGWMILQRVILRAQRPDSPLLQALGRDVKGKVSPVLYLAGIGCGLLGVDGAKAWIYAGVGLYALVAVLWLVPDRRIERAIAADS
jgi:uncharacterized membrane protein